MGQTLHDLTSGIALAGDVSRVGMHRDSAQYAGPVPTPVDGDEEGQSIDCELGSSPSGRIELIGRR